MLRTKQRDKTLDAMKGILIILVVLGHIIVNVYAPDNFTQNLLFRICYSFHMPAFIIVSGYLVGKKGIENLDGKWIKRRVISIGVPYMLWLCVSVLKNEHYISPIILANEIFGGGSVWFLRCLLLMDSFFYLLARTIKMLSGKFRFAHISAIAGLSGGYFMGDNCTDSCVRQYKI